MRNSGVILIRIGSEYFGLRSSLTGGGIDPSSLAVIVVKASCGSWLNSAAVKFAQSTQWIVPTSTKKSQ
jgi:hypothetical protein